MPASKALYGAVVERRLTHDGHGVLAQHVANAIQRSSRRGWRFDKPSDTVKIDALIALVMAWDRSQTHAPETAFLGWL